MAKVAPPCASRQRQTKCSALATKTTNETGVWLHLLAVVVFNRQLLFSSRLIFSRRLTFSSRLSHSRLIFSRLTFISPPAREGQHPCESKPTIGKKPPDQATKLPDSDVPCPVESTPERVVIVRSNLIKSSFCNYKLVSQRNLKGKKSWYSMNQHNSLYIFQYSQAPAPAHVHSMTSLLQKYSLIKKNSYI